MAWLATLREAGVTFGFPDDFPSKQAGAESVPLALLKHDIHRNLDRALSMAQAEHEKGIAGLYFMMGPHHMNKDFFGSQRWWDQLRAIQGLGHRLGLHLDVIDAILRRGDLYEEIDDVMSQFSAEGLDVRYGNSHGNVSFASLGVHGGDFFGETSKGARIAVVAGPLAAKLNDHLGRYSLKHIGERFGLRYWVDGRVFRDGVRLAPTIYVSDNSGSIEIPALHISSKRFETDAAFVAASISALRGASSLILLHPQWYVQGPPATKQHEPAAAHFNPQTIADLRDLKLDDSNDLIDASVRKGGFRYDFRLNRRRKASHLIVALHGGVAGAKELPVLARWKQDRYFRAPILSIFDPLIHEHPDIPAGWFVGDLARDATSGFAEIVRGIAARMNIDADRVVFIGGSAGGFGSVRLACALGGAKFISINGQARIIDYYASGYRPFSAAFDAAHTPQENAALHESRWSTSAPLEKALLSGGQVRGMVIQNVNDTHHFEKHYTPFCAQLGLPIEGGYSADKQIRSVPYEGEATHGAEPASIAKRIVKEFIPELLA